jgi:hypothetical protein
MQLKGKNDTTSVIPVTKKEKPIEASIPTESPTIPDHVSNGEEIPKKIRKKAVPKKTPECNDQNPVTTINVTDPTMCKNAFFKFLDTLTPSDYPMQAACIRRYQKFHRPALLEDSIELFLIFLKKPAD